MIDRTIDLLSEICLFREENTDFLWYVPCSFYIPLIFKIRQGTSEEPISGKEFW